MNLGVGIPAQYWINSEEIPYYEVGAGDFLVFPLLCDFCDEPATYDSEDICCEECDAYFRDGAERKVEATCRAHLPDVARLL